MIVAVILYTPGLSGAFFFDDITNIVDNPSLRLFDGSFSSLMSASTGGIASPLGRPLSMMSFALNFHFFGDGPFSFKLINLLIHLANGILVFTLVRQIWARLSAGDQSSIAALWITAVWLLHPINLPPVLLVVQRMTSLASFFTLAALCLYLYGRQHPQVSKAKTALALSFLVCWPLAILCKETGLLLPLFVLVCEWLVLDSFAAIPRKKKWLGVFFIGLVAAGITIMEWHIVVAGYKYRDFGLVERLLTEARVLWYYCWQITLPLPDLFGLYHDDIATSRGLLSPPQTLFAIVGWLSLFVVAIYKRKQMPMFAFAVIWFLAAHVLESTILPLEIVFEHRNYLASIGILIWMAALLFSPRWKDQRKLLRYVLAASFLLFCALVTTLRAAQWGDEFRRTQMEVAAHPNSARTNYEAGIAIVEKTFGVGKGSNMAYQMAQDHLKRSAELDLNGKAPVMGQLYLDCIAGVKKNESLQVALRERFAHGRFLPGDQGVIRSLSSLFVEKRLCLEDVEVKAILDAALSNPAADGRIRGMLNSVGMDYAIAKIGSLPLGLSYARAAINSDPENVALHINLVHLLLASNDLAESRREYVALTNLRITPSDKDGIEQLGQKLRSMEQNAHIH